MSEIVLLLFKRVIDSIIRFENLKDTFAYLDEVTVCGKNQVRHNKNLKKFLLAVLYQLYRTFAELTSFQTTETSTDICNILRQLV